MFEGIAPGVMKKWLILAALVYLVLPFDVLPDPLGLLGRVDDLGVMALLTWYFRNHVKRYAASVAAAGGAAGTRPGSAPDSERGSDRSSEPGSKQPRSAHPPDPYRVLGVERTASRAAIHSAYRARMQEYHPDKVAHLGEDLQKLAHSKSQEIQRAYRELS